MNGQDRYGHEQCHGKHGSRRGRSSYRLQDPRLVFGELKLREGHCFVDMGCGPGDYAIRASGIVGDTGIVYALDVSHGMVEGLKKNITRQGLENIKAMVCDITGRLPIEGATVDVCLSAMVLHIPTVTGRMGSLLEEVHRILKPDGRFAVIECKKEGIPFGPPVEMRLSPEDIEYSAKQYGFERTGFTDLGYSYLIQFTFGQSRRNGERQ